MVSERLRISFMADVKFKLTISQNGKWTGKNEQSINCMA